MAVTADQYQEMLVEIQRLGEELRLKDAAITTLQTQVVSKGKGKGYKDYETKLGKQHIPNVLKSGKGDFIKFNRSLVTLLEGNGYRFPRHILTWAKRTKTEINIAEYNKKCKGEDWTDEGEEEHEALNRMIRMYLELYTDGGAAKIVQSVKE